jgi:hypothetical protein
VSQGEALSSARAVIARSPKDYRVAFLGMCSHRERTGSKMPSKRDDFSSNRHPALGYWWSMMFSENRYPLFGIML